VSRVEVFLYVVLPYLALTVFVVGHIWRWRTDQFGWTTRSSQLYERSLLRYGSPLFHYGTLAAVGISEPVYHLIAAYAGTAAWIVVVLGLGILIWRRATNPRVRKVTTRTDVATYTVMTIVIVLGSVETTAYSLLGISGGDFDYRTTVSVWFRQIFAFHPDPALIVAAPLIYQVHVIAP